MEPEVRQESDETLRLSNSTNCRARCQELPGYTFHHVGLEAAESARSVRLNEHSISWFSFCIDILLALRSRLMHRVAPEVIRLCGRCGGTDQLPIIVLSTRSLRHVPCP